MTLSSNSSARPHIYEFDLLRSLTAITVVAVHVLAFTSWLYSSSTAIAVHYAVLDTIHWTRDIFLFITAFVLTYVYYGRPFSTRRFWIKRSVGVLLPYSSWSIAYTWSGNVPHQPLPFAKVAILDILTGNASYQLYYILLTLQLYLVLPLFLRLLRYIARHPWRALGISFALELALTYVSYQYLQQGPIASSSFGQPLNDLQDRFVLTYQFYIILGGVAALYVDQARAFLLSHGKWVIGIFALGLAVALGDYGFDVLVLHTDAKLASTVLQPAMTIYGLAVIIFLWWLGMVWAKRTERDQLAPGYRFWHLLSDASFGIYLVHAFILTAVFIWILPRMPAVWPAGLRIFLTWALTASSATLFSVILLHIPIASRLVGRPVHWNMPQIASALHRRFGSRLPRGSEIEAPQ